jgi:putative phosphoesterase
VAGQVLIAADMRIAIITDIHANITAFEAVLENLRKVAADIVVVGGDMVGSGSSPARVIDRIRELGWPAIQGNSDEMLWNSARVDAFFATPSASQWRPYVDRAIAATIPAIGDERLGWLRALPFRWTSDQLTVVHASPGDAWRSPTASATDDELTMTYGQLRARRVAYGHTHSSFVRSMPTMTVVNAGSVGLPYDDDPRASYALLDGGEITIRRVEYDVEREIGLLKGSSCPDAEWIAGMLREARFLLPAPGA